MYRIYAEYEGVATRTARAHKDLIRKARERELYTLEKRVKVTEAAPQSARKVWGA